MKRIFLLGLLYLIHIQLIDAQTELKLQVSGSCDMCTDRIEDVSKKTKGVLNATYNLKGQTLTLNVDQAFDKASFVASVLKLGHDIDGNLADTKDYEALPACCYYRNPSTESHQAVELNADGSHLTLNVSGACEMCKNRIESTAKNVIGVLNATYSLSKHTLTIEYDPSLFLKKEVISSLLKAGHDTEGMKASQQAYDNLPACCKYLDEKKEEASHAEHQHVLRGTIFEKSSPSNIPLIGANITWMGTSIGTVTDTEGKFRIETSHESKYLIVSYLGYTTDTVLVENGGNIEIVIEAASTILDAVEISHRKRTTEVSFLDVVKVQSISSKELLKAACCSLAESFDTTPAIDASVTDAITGTRKIEMLGLAGPYIQLTRENIPDVRGLAAVQGLAFTPGAWIEGMQLNTGAGSVVNGFESFTGQINVELRKPCHEEKLHFNVYASQAARFEVNTFSKEEVNENWSTATLLHVATRNQRRDHNHDGFLDMPLGKQFSFINRWKWSNNNGQEGQIGIKLTYSDNVSGQNDFDPIRSSRQSVWGADMTTNRGEFWIKRGFVRLDRPYKTLGFQLSGVYHDQKSQFGLRRYDASQKSLYFNMIYQTIVDNTNHQVRMGTSFQYDRYDEMIVFDHYKRNEWVPGVFGEYTYKGNEKYSILFGLRSDYHNNFGLFFTPKLNLRYAPNEATVVRLAIGRGQRTASIFAENIGAFASNRQIIVEGNNTSTPYGLNAEVAWNFGASITKEISFSKRRLFLSLDLNRVSFVNQIIADFDRSARKIVFYNLNGASFSNSVQLQAEINAFHWLDVKVAYRYNDVKATYDDVLLPRPLISPQRYFVNTAIRFSKSWVLDYTINWLSSMRIPSTKDNDEAHIWPENSPSFFLSNAQLSKKWNKCEVYLGGENIFNYRLEHPIISAHDPFSQYFDSSLAWGPIMGVNVYMGVRFSL